MMKTTCDVIIAITDMKHTTECLLTFYLSVTEESINIRLHPLLHLSSKPGTTDFNHGNFSFTIVEFYILLTVHHVMILDK